MFFIGFNYLLWDRENKQANIRDLQDTNEVKSDTIEILYRQISNLDKANDALENTIKELNEKIESYENMLKEQQEKNRELSEEILKKERDIAILKQQVDKDVLINVIMQWVNALGSGDLETAYKLTYGNTGSISFEDYYRKYRGAIISIDIHSLQELVEENAGPRKEYLYNIVLDIQLSENVKEFDFENGLNSRVLVLDYNEETDGWIIKDIVAGS